MGLPDHHAESRAAGGPGSPITISRYGTGLPIINANFSATARCIDVAHDWIVVDGVQAQNTDGTGLGPIRINGAANVTIKNSIIKNAGSQGYVLNCIAPCPNLTVVSNTFTKDAGTLSDRIIAVNGPGSDNPVISNNTINDMQAFFGIVTFDVNGAQINGNALTGNGMATACNANTANMTVPCNVYENVIRDVSGAAVAGHPRDGEAIEITGCDPAEQPSVCPSGIKYASGNVYRNTIIDSGGNTNNCTGGQDARDSQVYYNICLTPSRSGQGYCDHWSTSGPAGHPVVLYNNSCFAPALNAYSFTSSV